MRRPLHSTTVVVVAAAGIWAADLFVTFTRAAIVGAVIVAAAWVRSLVSARPGTSHPRA